jgi:hypothetical protein
MYQLWNEGLHTLANVVLSHFDIVFVVQIQPCSAKWYRTLECPSDEDVSHATHILTLTFFSRTQRSDLYNFRCDLTHSSTIGRNSTFISMDCLLHMLHLIKSAESGPSDCAVVRSTSACHLCGRGFDSRSNPFLM